MPSRDHLDRRSLLQAAAAVAGTLWLPRSAWAQPALRENPFALGVASGSARHDSVVLWTRLTTADGQALAPSHGDITVRWELAHDDRFQRIVQQGQAVALAGAAHAVHAELQGLESARPWFYRFMLGGAGQDWVSPIGRTRTLPAPDQHEPRLRVAFASCQRWEHGHFAAWRHLAAEQPDLVLFLGDYIYEYPSASKALRNHRLGWCLSLDDYRKRYALYRSDPALQLAHAAAPWQVIWDDHEVQNDYAGEQAGDGGPPVADFAQRRSDAYQAFYEHMPVRATEWLRMSRTVQGRDGRAPYPLHGQVSLGRLGSLFWLDTRQYRDAQVCTREGDGASGTVNPDTCAAWHDPNRSLLGGEQEAWLDAALGRTPREGWQLLAQTTLFGPRDVRRGKAERYWNDGWDGYSSARQRLTDSLQRHRVANPVLLGGDIHENWVGHVKADYRKPSAPPIGLEFCGTSISSRSGGLDVVRELERTAERLAENPHFVFADSQQRGYGLLELSAQKLVAHLRVVDDVERADSGLSTLARFQATAGRQQLERL